MRRGSIRQEMVGGAVINPIYEIKPSDIDRVIDEYFGNVQLSDVGRLLVLLKDDILQMESMEQKERRHSDLCDTRGPAQPEALT